MLQPLDIAAKLLLAVVKQFQQSIFPTEEALKHLDLRMAKWFGAGKQFSHLSDDSLTECPLALLQPSYMFDAARQCLPHACPLSFGRVTGTQHERQGSFNVHGGMRRRGLSRRPIFCVHVDSKRLARNGRVILRLPDNFKSVP